MALTDLDVGLEVPGPGPQPRIVAEASNLVSAVVVPLVAGLDSGATGKLVIRLWPDGHRASPLNGGTTFVLHEGVLLLETAVARFRLPSSEASFDEVALAVLDVVTVLLPEAAADQGWDVHAYRAALASADRSVPLLVPWAGPWVSSRRGLRARAVGALGRTARGWLEIADAAGRVVHRTQPETLQFQEIQEFRRRYAKVSWRSAGELVVTARGWRGLSPDYHPLTVTLRSDPAAGPDAEPQVWLTVSGTSRRSEHWGGPADDER